MRIKTGIITGRLNQIKGGSGYINDVKFIQFSTIKMDQIEWSWINYEVCLIKKDCILCIKGNNCCYLKSVIGLGMCIFCIPKLHKYHTLAIRNHAQGSILHVLCDNLRAKLRHLSARYMTMNFQWVYLGFLQFDTYVVC